MTRSRNIQPVISPQFAHTRKKYIKNHHSRIYRIKPNVLSGNLPRSHSTTAQTPCVVAASRARTSPRVSGPRLMSIAGVGLTTFTAGERPASCLFIRRQKHLPQPYAPSRRTLSTPLTGRNSVPNRRPLLPSPRTDASGPPHPRPRPATHTVPRGDVTSISDAPPTQNPRHQLSPSGRTNTGASVEPIPASPHPRTRPRALTRIYRRNRRR